MPTLGATPPPSRATAHGRMYEALPSIVALLTAAAVLRSLGPDRDFRVGVRVALSAIVIANAIPYAEHVVSIFSNAFAMVVP
jgi:hypothetical protein